MTGQTPPGWYADPYGTPGLQRWWDGAQWTQATQPTDEWDDAPPPAPFVAPGQEAPGYGRPPWSGQGAQQIGWGLPQQPQPAAQPPAQPPQPAQQGWPAQPAAPARSNKTLIWVLSGGGGVVAIGLIVALLFVTGAIGGGGGSSPSPTASPTNSTAIGGGGQSPVIGTITDTQSGLSYAQLGGKWYLETPSNLSQIGFSKGEVAHVQEDYKDPTRGRVSAYFANVYSGLLSTKIAYSGDLEAAAKSEFGQLETTNYPKDHTRQDGDSKAYSVSGKKAWYFKTVLQYPNASQYGWNFHSETVVVIAVDRGTGQRPAILYISIPDSHQNLGDLTEAINSLKAQ
jgi:hypothetical protein